MPAEDYGNGTAYGMYKYVHPDSGVAAKYEAQEWAIVLEMPDGVLCTVSVVNGSMCLNPLGHIPDATTFDAYMAEALMTNPAPRFVGCATFNPQTCTYELQVPDPEEFNQNDDDEEEK